MMESMVMMAVPNPLGVADLQRAVEYGPSYPYYAVLLYTPLNGLNRRLHKYVDSRWELLNELTGTNCLMVAVEKRDHPIKDFRPEVVYEIARWLGVAVNQLPCVVIFSEPRTRQETILLELSGPLGERPSDAKLTTFFADLQVAMDDCVLHPGDLFSCLKRVLVRERSQRRWSRRRSRIEGVLKQSVVPVASVLQALVGIATLIARGH
jgi:hypothetical protein